MAIIEYFDAQNQPGGALNIQPVIEVFGKVMPKGKDTKAGSLRIKIPTMPEERNLLEDVPYLTAYGGGDHGMYFLPEEGDEVIVKFLGGDYRHPVAYASRYKQDSALLKQASEDKNLIKLCKIKNGSSVMFHGGQGKEKITAATPKKWIAELDEEKEQASVSDKDKKNELRLDAKNGKASLKAEKELVLECGKSKLILKENGTIRLECSQVEIEAKSVAIKGKSKVEIEGQEVTVKGSTGITLNGQSKVQVKSSGPVKVSGSVINLN